MHILLKRFGGVLILDNMSENIHTSKIENSFYDIYQISAKAQKTWNEIFGIEEDKTADELYDELQNK